MHSARICLALVALGFVGGAAVAQPAPPTLLEAVLDFSSSDGEDPAADAFFAQVEQNVGQVVELRLTIVPSTNADSKGYTLGAMRPAGDAAEDGSSDDVVCGGGTFGFVENYDVAYELDTGHTRNFHAPTTILIGPRLQFPHQSLRCSAEDAGASELTPLLLSGFYLIDHAAIPTADHTLFVPVNP